jgi:hypothetical protein
MQVAEISSIGVPSMDCKVARLGQGQDSEPTKSLSSTSPCSQKTSLGNYGKVSLEG